MLHDVTNGQRYMPLQHLAAGPGADRDLQLAAVSEAGVLGFEYGYSLDWPDALVMWEAQFGDFVNAAQVIIDQFLVERRRQVEAPDRARAAAAARLRRRRAPSTRAPAWSASWRSPPKTTSRSCSRPRRRSSSTCLRRQVLRPWRKPLVIFTPKSLLRHPQCDQHARRVRVTALPARHPRHRQVKKPSRVLLCTGKVYYDLEKRRTELGRDDVAIVRVEQLYPLARRVLRAARGALRRRHAGRLGPGRAGEHGRLAHVARALRLDDVRPLPVLGRLPPREREPRHRLRRAATSSSSKSCSSGRSRKPDE